MSEPVIAPKRRGRPSKQKARVNEINDETKFGLIDMMNIIGSKRVDPNVEEANQAWQVGKMTGMRSKENVEMVSVLRRS